MESVSFRIAGEGRHKIAFAMLNSEATLNALTLDMVRRLTPQLAQWKHDPSIAAVVLHGAGDRAFCAGGDIKRLYMAMTTKQLNKAEDFYEGEYKLDYAIHTYPKPFLVWGNGVVMGGGLGLMAGATHRVVTETTKMAMPEITIGLYPDVGASYFLNRLPPGVGLFLGLTAARMNPADCLFTGLGNVFARKADQENVFRALESAAWGAEVWRNTATLNALLAPFEREARPLVPAGEIEARLAKIQRADDCRDVAAFAEYLRAQDASDKWMQAAAKGFFGGSPTSARVIFEHLRHTRGLRLDDCFRLDMTLSSQFARHHDLTEGIRALLIDKDNQPRWSPASIEEVTDATVREHFNWPHADKENPLANGGLHS